MKSEQDDTSISSPKKARFTPKIPIRKRPKVVATKGDKPEMKDNVIDKELLERLGKRSEKTSGRRVPKTEGARGPVEVAFGLGSTSLIRSFGNRKSAVDESKREESSDVPVAGVKEFVEPWDYEHCNYPTTLPLRRPRSGDPESLDEEEFGEDAVGGSNKISASHAEELGLMEPSNKPQMFFIQFPAALPLRRSSGKQNTDDKSRKGCGLKDLPSGFMGKMLVHKSGKVKMKIGDTLFDVSPGHSCEFAEDVAVMNVKGKHCCILGDLPKRALVTPDIASLLRNL